MQLFSCYLFVLSLPLFVPFILLLCSAYSKYLYLYKCTYCSDPLEGGGTIYSNGFFVQSISTDRYNHRTELGVVSLKSPSSVEYRIKKIFLNFGFYRELPIVKILRNIDEFPMFLFLFSGFSLKISSILIKIGKIVNNSTVNFIFRDRKSGVDNFHLVFLAKIMDKYFKIQHFSSKIARNCPKVFETIECSKWTNSSSEVGVVGILDCCNQ